MQISKKELKDIITNKILESSIHFANNDAIQNASKRAALAFVSELGLSTSDAHEVASDVSNYLQRYAKDVLGL